MAELKSRPQLSDDTASKLLANVFDACGREHNTIPLDKLESYSVYRRERYSLQKTLVVITLLIFAALPLCFVMPKFTVVETTQPTDAAHVYEIRVKGSVPVSTVAASIGDHPFQVYETGEGTYAVEPNINGKMKVKVTLINKQYAVREVDVTEVDLDKPILISQKRENGKLYLYLADGEDGSGINWDGIYAENIDGKIYKPVEIDRYEGYVAFSFPKESVNIYVPDNKGNTLQLLLTTQNDAGFKPTPTPGPTTTPRPTVTPRPTATPRPAATPRPTTKPVRVTPTPAPQEKKETLIDNATAGEKNALRSAMNHLEAAHYSYRRLYEQLEKEGYSSSEVTFALNNCGADWNVQAAGAASDYLYLESYSKKELIEKLEEDGFPKEQAEYGANHAH